MSRSKVIVVGGGLAGLATALTVARALPGDVAVTVVSAGGRLVFSPSLVRVSLGERRVDDVSFPLAPTLAEHEIGFVHDTVTRLDLDARRVHLAHGEALAYDHLVVATGSRDDPDALPGVGPGEPAGTITTADGAADVADRWRRFLDRSGHGERTDDGARGDAHGGGGTGTGGGTGSGGGVVVAVDGASRNAAAAYEYLFALPRQLARAGLRDEVRLTFVTTEPALGAFAGRPEGDAQLVAAMGADGIEVVTGATVDRVEAGRVVLASGAELPFGHAVVVPPATGGQAVREEGKIADADGYVRVRDTGQSESYDEVYAVGAAGTLPAPWRAPAAVGLPTPALTVEQQACQVARSIAAQLGGAALSPPGSIAGVSGADPGVGPGTDRGAGTGAGPGAELPRTASVLDAGEHGLLVLADELRPPRNHGVLVPWPQSRALTLAAERYLLWRARQGHVAVA